VQRIGQIAGILEAGRPQDLPRAGRYEAAEVLALPPPSGPVVIGARRGGGPASPPPSGRVVIEARRGWVRLDLRELWSFRDLVALLALRDLRARYKQSLLGGAL